jgi:hypothetical protein
VGLAVHGDHTLTGNDDEGLHLVVLMRRRLTAWRNPAITDFGGG